MKRLFSIIFFICTLSLLLTTDAFADDNALFSIYAPTENDMLRKYGYANISGQIVIPPIYDHVYGSSDGVIIVSNEIDVKRSFSGSAMFSKIYNSELIGLDASGNTIFRIDGFVNVDSFSDNMICLDTKEGKGYVNISGEYIIPPKFKKASPFKDGYAVVSLDEKNYAVIDKEGNIVLPYREDLVGYVNEGLFEIRDPSTDKYGCIDINGNIIIECKWDYMNAFHEGLCEVRSNDKCGFINIDGSLVVPCEYDGVGIFSYGLAPVQKNSIWGYVNIHGDIEIPLQWDEADSFSDGYAAAKDNKWGFIDTAGNLVIPYKYHFINEFKDGLTSVTEEYGDEMYYIDETGSYVMDKCVDVKQYKKLGDKYVMIDEKKRPVTSAKASEDEAEIDVTSSDGGNDKESIFQTISKGSKGDEVKQLQNRLNELGYSVGKADGDFGNKTKAAIEAFQKDNGLDVTGIADLETQELLFSDKVANKGNKEADKLQAITKGIDYITDYALEYLPTVFSAFGSTSSCKIIEVYCEEKGDDIYELTAKGRSGANSIGIGLNLKIIKDQNGKWNISETSSPHMYMGGSENNLPGKLVWSTDDKGYDALMDAFRELGKAVDANGDGQISYDEIFETK